MTHKNHHHRHHESSTEQTRSTSHHHHHGGHRSSPIEPPDPDSWTRTTSSTRPKRTLSPSTERETHCLSQCPCRSSPPLAPEQGFSSPTMTDSPTANRTYDLTSPAPLTGAPQPGSMSPPLQTPFWTFLSVTLTMIFKSLIFRK